MKVVRSAATIIETSEKGLFENVRRYSTPGGRKSYFLRKWGIKRRPGMRRKAGKVMRLNMPKTTTKERIAHAKIEDRCCNGLLDHPLLISGVPTLFSTIRWIKTRLQATARVSIEFENVCVWYVHVTYEDATSIIATRRWRGDCTSS
jgi:hypothetical protein